MSNPRDHGRDEPEYRSDDEQNRREQRRFPGLMAVLGIQVSRRFEHVVRGDELLDDDGDNPEIENLRSRDFRTMQVMSRQILQYSSPAADLLDREERSNQRDGHEHEGLNEIPCRNCPGSADNSHDQYHGS